MSTYEHEEYGSSQDHPYEQQQLYDERDDHQRKFSKKTQSQNEEQDSEYEKKNNHRQDDSQEQNHEDDDDSQNESQKSQQESVEIELTSQQKLQQSILQAAINNQQVTPYQHQLTLQLFQKLKSYQHASHGKLGEDLITLRIQQLVLTKILVLTYNKHELRLILSHYHLGQAYLSNQCIEQAIQHISLALHKIQKLFNQLQGCRLLATYMQNQLANAFVLKENYQDAIELLNESIKEENRLKDQKLQENEEKKHKNTNALVLLAQCYAKIGEYEQAINVIDEVINLTKKKKMAKQEYAFALVQKAKILALQKKFTQAITFQQEAIDILMEQNYSKPQQVAQLYTILSSYHEELGNIENSLTCIQKVKTLYQELYSAEDKRVIKARRKIATFLLKSERFKEAVNQLLEVVQLEEKVFGQNSLQTARTLKLLGAVYISMQVADARAYLKRAMNIFQAHGNKKQVQEIRDKLKMLYNGGENDPKDVRLTGSEHQI